MSLAKFILRRVLLALPVLIGTIALSFILLRTAIPPDRIVWQRMPRRWSQEVWDAEWSRLGFDKPIFVQFLVFIQDLFVGNWGVSYTFVGDSNVRDIIFQRLPRTLELAILCLIISVLIGMKLGILTGSNRNKMKDKTTRIITYIAMAVPPFIFAIFFSYVSAYENIELFPYFGYKSPGMPDPPAITNARILDCILSGNWFILLDYLYHLVIPMTAMIIFTLSIIFRQSRSSMVGVLQEDYIRTARAKGCTEKIVVITHALKNAMGPSITMIAYVFPKIFAGFIALEVAFQFPGIGDLFYRALTRYDFAIVIPIIFLVSIIVLILNLIADIAYAIIDPRIRLK